MQQTKKYIEECKCPCCNVSLNGWFYGDESVFGLIGGISFFKFVFNCPNKNRKISLLESKALTTKVFWLVEQENILKKYVTFQNTHSPNANLAIIYLYFPYGIEHDFDGYLKDKLEELKQNHIIGWAYPTYLKEKLDKFRYYVDIEWILDEKMFDYCQGIVYSSILAEANIINESKNWLRCKLLSNYPTMYPNFECFGNIDLEKLKQTII